MAHLDIQARSLQACCFMKLIDEFETFPPESLALLPLRLRCELIQNLPAVDVCQLEMEQSSFVEGMDMEKVWAAICSKCELADPKALNRSKDHFFSEVCKIIFNTKSSCDRITRLLLLLFSTNCCLGSQTLAIGDGAAACYNSLHHRKTLLQLPPRCQKEYNSWSGLSNPAECIQLVLEKTGYHPKSLEINNAYDFYECFLSSQNSSWHEGGDYYQLLVKYLSEVCYLTISLTDPSLPYHSIGENVNKVVSFIMLVLSDKGQLCLKEFSIMNKSNFLENTVFTISPYLKTSGGSNTLESLSINSSGCVGALSDDAAILELTEIIESQTSLCRLRLVLPDNSIYASSGCLCSALTGLLRQPQFGQMEIVMPMPSSCFQEIIHSFMVVPRSEDCSLSLGGFVVKDDQSARDLSCLNPPQENAIHKTLILRHNVHLPHTSRWLHEHVVLRLKELHLELDFHGRSPSLTHLLSHPGMEVERLSLSFGHCVLSDQNFEHLLQNIHLKHLSIYIYGFGQINIPSLVNGLHKQAQVGSLESLKVRDKLDDYDEDDITQLFDAIVSLPQSGNFTLDINFNDQHADILYKLWKNKAGGKRFKRLCCAVSSPERSILQYITHELVHVA